MSGLYEQLCNLFIRPARQSYSQHDLGPYVFGQSGNRENFTISAHGGSDIKASLFKNRRADATCILQRFSSLVQSRQYSALRYASELLQKGYHFCSFDFSGCGNSKGQYVTLGCNQRWDVLKILQHLHQRYGIRHFFLWGRSMGAVAAIKFYSLLVQQQNQHRSSEILILGLILDSAFISLKRMVVEVAQNRISVPQFLIKAVFMMVGSSIEERAGFKVDQLELINQIDVIRCSTLLIASKQDSFVSYRHSQDIYAALKVHQCKQIQYTKGQHYQNRDNKTLAAIYAFLEKNNKKLQQSLTRISYHKNITSQIQQLQLSLQKPTKSLKKYEPKLIPQRRHTPKPQQLKTALFRSSVQQQARLSHEFRSAGSDKKIQIPDEIPLQRQYQTQKRIQSNNNQHIHQPQIKIFIASAKSGIRHKNQLRNKSKPTLPNRPQPTCEQTQITAQQTHTVQIQHENHCNIITDKLKRKRKQLLQKQIQFNQPSHINTIKFESQTAIKVNFSMANPATPTTSIKKQSVTAKDYKNRRIHNMQGFLTLSPGHKKIDKTPFTQSKATEERTFQQTKSLSNLTLHRNDKKDSRSYKKINPIFMIAQQQPHQG